MANMFDLTLRLAMKLGTFREGLATAGTDTTHTTDTSRVEGDDTFNGGTLWVIWDADGADAAPQGEWARVTDFVKSTGVITHDALTAATAAGDRYGISTGRYPLDVLKSAINSVLIEYKQVLYDTTSLDTVNQQSELTLPAGITGANLVQVYAQTNDDADDNRWVPINYHVLEAATGSQHTLVIDSRNVSSDVDLMLEYTNYINPLYNADDEVDPVVPVVAILPQAAYQAELIRQRTFGSESKLDIAMLKHFEEQAQQARRRWPMRPIVGRGKVIERSTFRGVRVAPPPRP